MGLAIQAKDANKVIFLPDEPVEVLPGPVDEELKTEGKAISKEEVIPEEKTDLKETIGHQKKKH